MGRRQQLKNTTSASRTSRLTTTLSISRVPGYHDSAHCTVTSISESRTGVLSSTLQGFPSRHCTAGPTTADNVSSSPASVDVSTERKVRKSGKEH
eukprot:108118-Rhodomonas_salina.1